MSTGGAEPSSFSRVATAAPVARPLSSSLAAEAGADSVLARYQAYHAHPGVPPLPSARRGSTATRPRAVTTFGRSATAGVAAASCSTERFTAASPRPEHTVFTVALRLPPSAVHKGRTPVLHVEATTRGTSVVGDIPAVAVRYKQERTEYIVDHAFMGDSEITNSQSLVFDTLIDPLVPPVMRGGNACVMAYGATGTGKTYSVFGPHEDPGIAMRLGERLCSELGVPCTPGAAGLSTATPRTSDAGGSQPPLSSHASREASPSRPRALSLAVSNNSFRGSLLREAAEGSVEAPAGPRLSVSFVELYCDRVIDLLDDGSGVSTSSHDRAAELKIKELQGGFVLRNEHTGAGETRVAIDGVADLRRCLARGLSKRTQGATRSNARSSRGHAIVTFHIASDHALGPSLVRLVDLAGSEKHHKNLPETGFINQSLLALGQVIHHLARRQPHVPFRDSLLTQLLRPVIGVAGCRCVMLATADPTDDVNTRNTLIKAVNAKRVAAADDVLIPRKRSQTETIQALSEENRALRLRLQQVESQHPTPLARPVGASPANGGANAGHDVEVSAMGPADQWSDDDFDAAESLGAQPVAVESDAATPTSRSLATPRHGTVESERAAVEDSPVPRTPFERSRPDAARGGETVAAGLPSNTDETSWAPDRFTPSSTPIVPTTARPTTDVIPADAAANTTSLEGISARCTLADAAVQLETAMRATVSVECSPDRHDASTGPCEAVRTRTASIGTDATPPVSRRTIDVSAVVHVEDVAAQSPAPAATADVATTAAILDAAASATQTEPVAHPVASVATATVITRVANVGEQAAPLSVSFGTDPHRPFATSVVNRGTSPHECESTTVTPTAARETQTTENAALAEPAEGFDFGAQVGHLSDVETSTQTLALRSVDVAVHAECLPPPRPHRDTSVQVAVEPTRAATPSPQTVDCGITATALTAEVATSAVGPRRLDFSVQVDQPRNVAMQTSPVQTEPQTPERPPPVSFASPTFVALTPVQVRQLSLSEDERTTAALESVVPRRRAADDAVACTVSWGNICGALLFAAALCLVHVALPPLVFDAPHSIGSAIPATARSEALATAPVPAPRVWCVCDASEKETAERQLFRDLTPAERGNLTCAVIQTIAPTERAVAPLQLQPPMWKSVLLYFLSFFGRR